MSETSSITGPLVEALTKAGIFAMRLNSGSARKGKYWIRLCPAGTADVVVYLPDAMPIWLETKAAKGWTNKEQQESQAMFRATVERLGHTYARVESVEQGLDVVLKDRAA